MQAPAERVQPPQQVKQSPVVLSQVLHQSLTTTHCPFFSTCLKGQDPAPPVLVVPPLLMMQAPVSRVQPSQQLRQSPVVELQVLHWSLTATHFPSFSTVLGAHTTVVLVGGFEGASATVTELQQVVSRVFYDETSCLSLTSKVTRVGTVGGAALGCPGSLLIQPTLIFFMSASRLNKSSLQVDIPMGMPLVTKGLLAPSERTTKRVWSKQPIPLQITKRTTTASGWPSLSKSPKRMRSEMVADWQPPFPSVITPSVSFMYESPPCRYVRFGSWVVRRASSWAQLLVTTMLLAAKAIKVSNKILLVIEIFRYYYKFLNLAFYLKLMALFSRFQQSFIHSFVCKFKTRRLDQRKKSFKPYLQYVQQITQARKGQDCQFLLSLRLIYMSNWIRISIKQKRKSLTSGKIQFQIKNNQYQLITKIETFHINNLILMRGLGYFLLYRQIQPAIFFGKSYHFFFLNFEYC